jgi:hypothetical protein
MLRDGVSQGGFMAAQADSLLPKSADFSLVPEGPIHQVCRRSALARILEPRGRRAIIVTAIAWLPLAVLSIAKGLAVGGVESPFFYDVDAHARLLISLPILVLGEALVDQRIRSIVAQFNARQLIAPQDRQRFDRAVAGVRWLKKSMVPELLMLVLALGVGHWLWSQHIALRITTWYASAAGNRLHLTAPGYWYVYVSLPIFRFMILRWLFRLGLWYWFLARVARIPLALNVLHPDRAGGLGFLSGSADAFLSLPLSQTIMLAAILGNRIWHQGASLPQFKLDIVVAVVLFLLLIFLPQAFFFVQLNQHRRAGAREYGAMASEYVREFWRKWKAGGAAGEPMLGSADIQSLADLGNSYDVASQMGVLPFGRRTIIRLGIMIALPFLPLVLTMVPLDEALSRIFKMVL